MEELIQKEFAGIKCWLRPNSSDEVVFDDNIQRAPVTKHLDIKPGQKWLDLGGYIGTFALYVRKHGCQVISVEANPANAKMYELNMGLNNFGYELFNGAVMHKAPESGEVTFYVMRESGRRRRNHAASTMFNRWTTKYPTINCHAMNFSDVVKGAFITYGPDGDWNLKIDIEGAEIEILLKDDLSHFNQIYWEYHFQADRSPKTVKAIEERLQDMGFTVYWSRKQPILAPHKWYEMTMMGWAKKEK